MVKCSNCGYCEIVKSSGIDPATQKFCLPITLYSNCTYNLKKIKKYDSPYTEIKCKKFIEKRPNFTPKDYHDFKDRQRSHKIDLFLKIVPIIISLFVTLIVPFILVPYLASPEPTVILTFEYFPDALISSASNSVLNSSFTLYNKGVDTAFIESIAVYEVFQNGSSQYWMYVDIGGRLTINTGQTHDVDFQLYNSDGLPANRKFQIYVFYSSSELIKSSIGTAIWT